MGSAAMDQRAISPSGYSASSSTVFPSMRYAGRLATDPPGTLARARPSSSPGLGSQSGTGNRWGDYSDMTVDPVDDCTFWYTNEYYPSGVSQFNWRTRIGSFKFPSCGGCSDHTPTARRPTPRPPGRPTRRRARRPSRPPGPLPTRPTRPPRPSTSA